MNIGYLVLILIILSLSTMGLAFKYAKDLKKDFYKEDDDVQKGRNEIKAELNKTKKKTIKVKSYQVIICGYFGGFLGLLCSYFAFRIIRQEDSFHYYIYLINIIISTIISIVVIILLFYFKVITF